MSIYRALFLEKVSGIHGAGKKYFVTYINTLIYTVNTLPRCHWPVKSLG
jgi:hypothetical protein